MKYTNTHLNIQNMNLDILYTQVLQNPDNILTGNYPYTIRKAGNLIRIDYTLLSYHTNNSYLSISCTTQMLSNTEDCNY